VAEFDAVILAGGSGRRLGGVDKAALNIAGLPLLDRVLRASVAARRTVVVGDRRPTIRDVDWVRERPAGGGPLAALAAGLDELALSAAEPASSAGGLPGAAPLVVVLATDLPWLKADDVDRLIAALIGEPCTDAALFVDAAGSRQPLTAAYRTEPIRSAIARVKPVHGKAVKLVLHQLAVVTVPDLGAAGDCDTPDQLAAARAHFDRQG